jgi:hypothetical protein
MRADEWRDETVQSTPTESIPEKSGGVCGSHPHHTALSVIDKNDSRKKRRVDVRVLYV